MLLDLANQDSPSRYEADLCIIGSGAAGITLATRLAGSGVDVLVVEGGGIDFEPASQAIYEGNPTAVYYPIVGSRLRRFGGTTNHWEGWCGMLRPFDFTQRAWIPGSGWPIRYSDVEPYYRLACSFLKLGEFDFEKYTGKPPASARTPKGADFFESFNIRPTPVPRLAQTQRQALEAASNVRVLLHASVLPIHADNGEIRELAVSTLDGKQATVRAKAFVLACGGLENSRILLASGNLANSSGMVGRCFMDHMFSTFAAVIVPPPGLEDGTEFFSRLNTPPLVGLAISEEAQAELGLLTCSIGVMPSPIPDSLKPPGPRGVQTAYPIMIHGECAPNPESRITLSPDQKDRFGVPRISLNWIVNDLTQRTVRETVLHYTAMLTRAGLGRAYVPPIKSELDWPFGLYPPCHPAGTTRMSDDPRHGVVNQDLRTHDIRNFYICSGSVFPTVGHMNPTMTIVALAYRLADHLKSVLGK